MGGNITLPIPCVCARKVRQKNTNNENNENSFEQTTKFMKTAKNVKFLILSYLEYDFHIYQVILFNTKLRTEFDITNFNFYIIRMLGIIRKRFKFNSISYSYSYSLNKLFLYFLKSFNISSETISFAFSLFFLGFRLDEHDLLITKDQAISINENKFDIFYFEMIKQYFNIASFLFTTRLPYNLYIKITKNDNNTIKNILEHINELTLTSKITLYIPENYCYSSLSILTNSENFTIIKIYIEKASLYVYGINMIEKKFENNSTLKSLIINEISSSLNIYVLSENEIKESQIYDKVDLDSIKNLINLNKTSLVDVKLCTMNYINLISDQFLNEILYCEKLIKLELCCKISKLNTEVVKKILKKNFLYFDICYQLINEEDFIEIELMKVINNFIFQEKIILFPLCQRLFVSPLLHMLNINSSSVLCLEDNKNEFVLDFNQIVMDSFEKLELEIELEIDLEINLESEIKTDQNNLILDSYQKNIKDLVDFININKKKSIRIIHNKKYSNFITKFITDFLYEIKQSNLIDNIEEFRLVYESESAESVFDTIFDFFLESSSITYISIEYSQQNKNDDIKLNKVNINRVLDFEFISHSSNKWINLLEILMQNKIETLSEYDKEYPMYIQDFSFTIKNEVFTFIFSEFILKFSNFLNNSNIMICTFNFDIDNLNFLKENNFSILLNFMISLNLLQNLHFIQSINQSKSKIKSKNESDLNLLLEEEEELNTNPNISNLNELTNLSIYLNNLRNLQFLNKNINIKFIYEFLNKFKIHSLPLSMPSLKSLDLSGCEILENNKDDLFKILNLPKLSNLIVLKLKIQKFFTLEKDVLNFLDLINKNLKHLKSVKFQCQIYEEIHINYLMCKFNKIIFEIKKYS